MPPAAITAAVQVAAQQRFSRDEIFTQWGMSFFSKIGEQSAFQLPFENWKAPT